MDILEVLRDMGIGSGKRLEGDAAAGDVRLNKTFMNAQGKQTGSLVVRDTSGPIAITPGKDAQALSAGIYDYGISIAGDADLISANIKKGANIFNVPGSDTVVDTADAAPAAAGDILAGHNAFVNGVKVVGSMVDRGQAIITPGTADITIAAGKHSGTGYVKGDVNLAPENIVAGKRIFNVDGNYDKTYGIGDAIACSTLGHDVLVSKIGITGTNISATPSLYDPATGYFYYFYDGVYCYGDINADVELWHIAYNSTYGNPKYAFINGGYLYIAFNNGYFNTYNKLTGASVGSGTGCTEIKYPRTMAKGNIRLGIGSSYSSKQLQVFDTGAPSSRFWYKQSYDSQQVYGLDMDTLENVYYSTSNTSVAKVIKLSLDGATELFNVTLGTSTTSGYCKILVDKTHSVIYVDNQKDGTLHKIDLSGNEIWRINGTYTPIAVSPDGEFVITKGASSYLTKIDKNGNIVYQSDVKCYVTSSVGAIGMFLDADTFLVDISSSVVAVLHDKLTIA